MAPVQHEVNGINGHTTQNPTVAHMFDSIEDSIAAIARGEFVIALDDTSRENEGDLIIAAEDCTTEKMAFLIRHTSGYVCAPVTAERAAALDLPPMVLDNRDRYQTAYTITIDSVGPHLTTGISAQNRAHTVRTLADPRAEPASFRRPGHVLPLIAKDGFTRVRVGHTEASLELCRLAGKQPAAALCEMVIDGDYVPGKAELSGARMMNRDDCLAFGKKWGIKVCTIEDLARYVVEKEGPTQSSPVD